MTACSRPHPIFTGFDRSLVMGTVKTFPTPSAEIHRRAIESRWRLACLTFLDACFHGAPRERIVRLGNEVLAARDEAVSTGPAEFRGR